MEKKIYAGSGKAIKTKHGEMMKISFSKKDIQTLTDNLSEKGWVNLVLKEKKEKVEGKPTHYLEVDTWKADQVATEKHTEALNSANNSDLPF